MRTLFTLTGNKEEGKESMALSGLSLCLSSSPGLFTLGVHLLARLEAHYHANFLAGEGIFKNSRHIKAA